MVADISQDITFGMCPVGSKGILLNIWYAFMTMWYAFTKTTENFNLG